MDLSILEILEKVATPAIIILLFILFGIYIQKVLQIHNCNRE